MQNNNINKGKRIFVTASCLLAGALLVFSIISNKADLVKAAGGDNDFSGYAWSENIGWINFRGATYGVSMNKANGKFDGYAWSENLGWIDFGPSSGYPSTPGHEAKMNNATGEVTGWAKIISTGEWIKMSGTAQDASPYGVTVALGTGKLSGYAWSDTIGWISFSGTGYRVIAEEPPSPGVQITSFYADDSVISSGASTTLNWTTVFADDCTASNDWSGAKATTSGSESTGILTTAKTYDLTCTGIGAPDSESVIVNILSDFSVVSSNSISASFTGGADATSTATTITVSDFGSFSDDVTLSVDSVVPNIPGIIYQFGDSVLDSSEYSTGSSFEAGIPGGTASGTYSIVITGTDESATPRSVGINLNIGSTIPTFEEI
jgi:hypothetical protein